MSLVEAEPKRRSRSLDFSRETAPSDLGRMLPNLGDVAVKIFGPAEGGIDAKALGASPRNFDAAFSVLRQSADVLERLQAERDKLRAELILEKNGRKVELETFQFEKAQLEKHQADIEDRLRSSQTQLDKAVDLVGILHRRLGEQDKKAAIQAQRTRTLEQIAMSFHDGILADFQQAATPPTAVKVERIGARIVPVDRTRFEPAEPTGMLSAAMS